MLLFITLFSIGVAGLLNASWWFALAGACVLALMFIVQDASETSLQYDRIIWEYAQTLSSVTIALCAGPLAFAAGRASGVLWGV